MSNHLNYQETNTANQDEMPLGLAFTMAMNEKAMAAYGRMAEDEKKSIIDAAKAVSSKTQMEQLVDRIGRGM